MSEREVMRVTGRGRVGVLEQLIGGPNVSDMFARRDGDVGVFDGGAVLLRYGPWGSIPL